MNISLVIALQDDGDILYNLTQSISNLKKKPNEIIIVDSSSNKEYSKKINLEFNNLDIKSEFYKIDKSFQGKALNFGINKTRYDYICLLDSKTIPKEDWLQEYSRLMSEKKFDVIWGSTKFNYNTYFQKLYRCATYGSISHKTLPGSLINKKIFSDEKYFFNERLRSSFDLEWKNLVDKNFICLIPKDNLIEYNSLPTNYFIALKKHVSYAFYTSVGKSDINIKELYFSIFLILSALIIPKWNFIISGWDNNPLYIPNITKIYLICLIIIFLFYQILKKIRFFKISNFFEMIIKSLIFILFTYGIYKWNASVASWVEDSIFYIPHITKIYLLIILICSFVFRGLIRPINRKEKIKFLIPFNWLGIGFIGLTIDLIKIPFYIFVTIYFNLLRLIRK